MNIPRVWSGFYQIKGLQSGCRALSSDEILLNSLMCKMNQSGVSLFVWWMFGVGELCPLDSSPPQSWVILS